MIEHPQVKFPNTPPDTRFYVVLSGLVPLVEFDGKLRAYMLFVKGHAHLAGQWLCEQDVPLGLSVTLRGVKAGNRHLYDRDADGTPLAKIKAAPEIDHPDVHACFDLPLPREIYYLNLGEIEIKDPDKELVAPPKFLSGTRVLEYELEKDFRDVFLDRSENDAFWNNLDRRTTFKNDAEVGSLHLIDGIKDPNLTPVGHNQQEYLLNSRAFGATGLSFGEVGKEIAPTQSPDGLSEFEILPLDWRPASTDYLADFLRTGGLEVTKTVGGLCRPCCAPLSGIVR